jgi:hypothetical protein
MKAPRPHPGARTRRAAAWIVVGLVGLSSLAGCDPRTLFYFLQPYEPTVPAPGPKLGGKRVVIVTRAVGDAAADYPSLDRDLSREVARILRDKIKKLDLVESDKVWTWLEGHPNWSDPGEIAQAFEADIVIFFEVEAFQLQNQGDLDVLQGTAKTHIRVSEMAHPTNSKGKPITDKPKEPKELYDSDQNTEFPRRGPVPMGPGVSRSSFKNRFLKIVAAELSWHFAEHAPEDDIQDAKFN